MAYQKPLPNVTSADRPFWEAAKEHRLTLPKCGQCGHVFFPPYLFCPQCISRDIRWIEASGKAKVWGHIEMAQPYLKSFEAELPYNVVLVELEEGPMMFSNVVGVPNEAIQVGMPLEAIFDDVTSEMTLVKFKPRSGS